MFEIPQDAYISHVSSGRLRARIPSKKRNDEFFAALQGELSSLPGVEQIQVNALTGSVLLLHSLDTKTLLEFAKSINLFNAQTTVLPCSGSSRIHGEVTSVFAAWDEKVKGFVGEGANLGSLAFLALLGAGIYQVARGNLTAIPWYTAFWYALNIFLKSKPSETGLEA